MVLRRLAWLACLALLVPAFLFGGGDTLWTRSWDPVNSKVNRVSDACTDAQGNLYICGQGINDTIQQLPTEWLVAKYRPNGDAAWIKTDISFGQWNEEDMAQAIAVDSLGNVFVAGVFDNHTYGSGMDMGLVKLNSSGVLQWYYKYNGQTWPPFRLGDDAFYDVVVRSGQVYACGVLDSTWAGGDSTNSAYTVMRFNPSTGAVVWRKSYILDPTTFGPRKKTNPQRDVHPDFFEPGLGDYQDWNNCATALAFASDGDLVSTGFGMDTDSLDEWWTMKWNPTNGTRRWARTYHNPECDLYNIDNDDVAFDVATSSGGIFVAGFDYLGNATTDQSWNMAVVSYDNDGNRLAYRSMDATYDGSDDYACALALDGSSVYVTGMMCIPLDDDEQMATVKLDPATLNPVWPVPGAIYGWDGADAAYDVTCSGGRVYVTGTCEDNTTGSDDLQVLCYTTADDLPKLPEWTYNYNSSSNMADLGAAIAVRDSFIYVGGEAQHPAMSGLQHYSTFAARLWNSFVDVGVTQVLAPTDTVDFGQIVAPACSVRNYGGYAVACSVRMVIAGGYSADAVVALGANQTQYLTFVNWTAQPIGVQPIQCFTRLVADGNRSNDTAYGSVTVRGPDVGVTMIVAPKDTVDWGVVVTPRCSIRNYRPVAQDVPIRLRIGATYVDDTTVTVSGSQTAIVEFVDWTAQPSGLNTVRCSTRLAIDVNPANDTLSGWVFVRGPDVGVTAILAPVDTVDLDAQITPQAEVRNYRPVAQVVPVMMRIGAWVRGMSVTLAGNEIVIVDFPSWLATPVGPAAVKCSTMLATDVNFANDTMTGTVFVQGYDVTTVAILQPTGTYVPGTPVTPEAVVRNNRTVAQTVPVRFTISGAAGYADATTITLAGNQTDTVSFMDWTANPPGGPYVAKCSTRLTGDVIENNNAVQCTVYVAQTDVGCVRIVAPAGMVDSGTTLAPEAWLRNYGSSAESFSCRMVIGAYADTQDVDLAAGASVLQGFRDITLSVRGRWAVLCSTMLAGDLVESNNMRVDSFTVRVSDVAALAILVPADTVDSGSVLAPELRVRNLGNVVETFWTHFLMQPVLGPVFYEDSLELTLPAAAEFVARFGPSAAVAELGSWRARGWVSLVGDQHPANDTAAKSFYVPGHGGVHWPHGWVEVQSMPLPPSSKQVKDGGSLTTMEDTAGALIYGIKGAKTADFYSYDYRAGKWTTRKPVPPGREMKLPYKGSRLCADGAGHVFLTKGNNTLGFWRYTAADSSWTQLDDVPLGTMRKKVKGGTDLVFVDKHDSGFVYMLKGYKNEFYRYNILRDTWEPLPLAPQGINIKWDNGSFLVMDGEHTIYAHKAKYNELWKYDTDPDTWAGKLSGMPFFNSQGRKKKSKDGGAGAWFNGQIYAFKGGNTQEFWRYVAARDSWYESDTLPLIGSTGKKKKVKNGGDLVYNVYAIWALKGNRTVEFWRYGLLDDDEGLPLAQVPERSGATAAGLTPAGWHFAVVPNPLSGSGALQFSVPYPTVLNVRLYDASGRLAAEPVLNRVALGSGALGLRTEGLSAGVYLLRLDVGKGRDVWGCKLVIR